MRNKEILKLLAGFRRFKARYFEEGNSLYSRLSTQGQTPKTLIIGCSDSRVDPGMLTSASPGEIFVVRNVANLVPLYTDDRSIHGVSAAIEFAVVNLRVENIIVLGHRQCGGIRALVEGILPEQSEGFISKWVKIAEPAKLKVEKLYPNLEAEAKVRYCEMEAIVVSVNNLKTFPFISKAVEEGRLAIQGAYFDLESGELLIYDESTEQFHNTEL